MNKLVQYSLLLAFVLALAYVLGLNTSQAVSLVVLGGMIGATLMFWRFRLVFAFFALAIMLGTNLLEIKLLIEFAHLDTILFLASMMMVVGYLEDARFFEVLMDKLLARVGNRPRVLVASLIAMSALLAALVDEVTSILIMAAIILDFTSRYNLNPVRFIILAVFATNIGSSATVVGNPVGVMIAFRAGLGFADFLRWATPISTAALFLFILISMYVYRTDIKMLANNLGKQPVNPTFTANGINGDKFDIRVPAAIFIATITGLILHTPIEQVLGLGKNAMLLGVPFLFAGAVMLLERERARELVERRIDWWTLLFFMIFFATVGTLNHTGATQVFANIILQIGGNSIVYLMVIIMVVCGLMSAFMDNVLAVATWIPIMKTLGDFGVNIFPLWWAMLFAGTLWGNLTIIGSTANIVAVGMLERRERIHITLRQWIGLGAAVTFPTVALSLALLYLQLPLAA
ncbi:MAG: SLC13 family permease [Candidatus Caldarchaeum sp.]|uniref:Citrate transporter-like domain-containing protein n=1 Tax=Caldiarchaeum subterraneum TaxID=311458 RepID=A0A7C5LDV0_CALS0